MIHGIISDSSFFAEISGRLSTRYKVITYDRRGYGNASRTEGMEFTVAQQAKDAADVLRQTCGEPAWIVGNSAGGLIALELCMRYPALTRGMLLVEPSISFDPECVAAMAEWNRELNDYLDSGRIKRALPAFGRVTGDPGAGGQGLSLSQMKTVYANLSNFMHGELNEVQRYTPTRQQLSAIPVPVQILITESGKDSIFGKSSLMLAKEMNWEAVFLPGYHNALRDAPDTSADCIHKCIEEIKDGEKRQI